MQPTQYPINFHHIYAQWHDFVEQGALDAEVDPLVAMSWRRCMPRHNPRTAGALPRVSDETLQALRVKHFELLAVARPFMEDIYQYVERSGSAVVLLDASACVLEILGDERTLAQLGALSLRPGFYWNEDHAGTNAFGLALWERSPVQVVGAEHLYLRFHALTASAAPIFDSSGHPIGILGMAGWVRSADVHTLAIVHSTARAIESQLQNDRLFMDVNIQRTQLMATLEAISDGLLVCDAAGLVTHVNSHAAQILKLKYETVVGRPLDTYIDLPEVVRQACRSNEAITELEVVFSVQGSRVGCLVSLYPIPRAGDSRANGFILTLRRIEQVHRLVHRMVGTRSSFSLNDFIGESPLAVQVRRQAQAGARSQSPILIQGEAGTGKGVLARVIHNESARADGPFVSINCRALPRELTVSEFLGYEPGAYRRAGSQGQPSKFELAHDGTLYLEEIDALPLEMQGALLRVIDSGEVLRLGGTRVIPVDVRFIATSSADLEQRVINGDFRADLYYALSRIAIRLPSLRDRSSDLPLLVNATLDRLRRQTGRHVDISSDALQVLRRYRWPGNVRELENALERAVTLCDGTIMPRNLPEVVRGHLTQTAPLETVLALHEVEHEAIVRAGWACQGNLTKMAEMLGIGRTTLWRKIKADNIHVEEFRRTTHIADR